MALQTHGVVVGGGVVGASVAWRLAGAGWRVTLLERGTPARESSAAAAGILGVTAEEPPPALAPLLRQSVDMYPAFARELEAASGLTVDLRFNGLLMVPVDEPHAAALRARLAPRADVRWLDPHQVRREHPGVHAAWTAHGAADIHGDGSVNPLRLTQALLVAARRAGVEVVEGAPVDALLERAGRVVGVRVGGRTVEADRVVVCAGAWSSHLENVGIPRAAIKPIRGQMLLLDSAEVPPQVVYRDHCYVVPRDGTRVVVGSTMEDVGYANAVTEEGMAHLREVAAGLHAPLAHATEAGRWAGMRPASVDGLPILGPGHLAGLVLATAHFRNGIALAPLTADLVTRWLTGRPVATSVDALAPSRFGMARAV